MNRVNDSKIFIKIILSSQCGEDHILIYDGDWVKDAKWGLNKCIGEFCGQIFQPARLLDRP